MPALYAHYRFGAKVSGRLNGELKEIVTNFHPQFAAGLQGPDLFFFYRPWKSSDVSAYGTRLHQIAVRPFLEQGMAVVKEKGRDSREYAYLLGFICHFILDSECHPYVAEMMEETGVAHLEIEEEFEKLLLSMDGKAPLSFPLEKLIPADEETAEAAAAFYGETGTEEVLQSLRDMKLVKRFFTAPGAAKQAVINTVMKLTGKHRKWSGLMIQRRDNPACARTNEGLRVRFNGAVLLAVELLERFDESLRTGKPLPDRFERNFE